MNVRCLSLNAYQMNQREPAQKGGGPSPAHILRGDAGNAVKKNLPAPVAKSLPNTGGGWFFLILIGAALIVGGFAIRTIVRRTTSVRRTAQ